LAGIRPSCGLSRSPGSRHPGISVGRSATRNRHPRTSHSLRILLFPGWRSSPHPATGHRSAFRERGQLARGASSTRFALIQPAKSSNCSTVSRASGASLIVRPPPRPLEAPLTAQLRLSRQRPTLLANTIVIEPAKLYWC
jgi:hypothetical protein